MPVCHWRVSLALTLDLHRRMKERLNTWSSLQPLLSSSVFLGARSYHCSFLLSNLGWIFWPDRISDEVHRPPDNCPHHHLGRATSL